MIKVIIGVGIAALLAYLEGGGWINNLVELSKNFQQSKLSISKFIHLIVLGKK